MGRIEDLRQRIESERASWPGPRWRCSRLLRSEVESAASELVGGGWSATRVSKELGLAPSTVGRWLACGDDPASPGRSFRRVEVGLPMGLSGLCLETPSGHRVTGLSLEQVKQLLAAI
jgi:hypothetical protein